MVSMSKRERGMVMGHHESTTVASSANALCQRPPARRVFRRMEVRIELAIRPSSHLTLFFDPPKSDALLREASNKVRRDAQAPR